MMRRATRGPLKPKIDQWEARQALNTVAQAREHLANPAMVKAMRAHAAAMNAAVSGPQRPKKVGR